MPQSTASVALICPSLGQVCGIAKYTSYVASALKRDGFNVQLMRSTHELFAPREEPFRFVIVQQEYGLLDNLSVLGTGESTATLLANLKAYTFRYPAARCAVVMHTVVSNDHVLNAINNQLFSSDIPIFHLNSRGCFDLGIPFLEHGVLRVGSWEGVSNPSPDRLFDPVLASFGLLSPNKRPTDLLRACQAARARFVGNFATNQRQLHTELLTIARELGVDAQIFPDFCDEETLLERLSGATFAAVAQDPIKHSATSGSVRLLFNLGIPVFAPYAPQFEDCSSCVIFANVDEIPRLMTAMAANQSLWLEAAQRIRNFSRDQEIGRVYGNLLNLLDTLEPFELTRYRRRRFTVDNTGYSVTLADLMARATSDDAPDGNEARIVEIVAEKTDAQITESAHVALEVKAPIEFPLRSDRLISHWLHPSDRLVLLTTQALASANLERFAEFASASDTFSANDRSSLLHFINEARGPKADLLKEKSAIVTSALLKRIQPQVYDKVSQQKVDLLRHVAVQVASEKGFRNSKQASISVSVLLLMPASQIFIYLMHVGGVSAQTIANLVGELGIPDNALQSRVAWVRSAAALLAELEPGLRISLRRPEPRSFLWRKRAFLTEFACLSDSDFALAIYYFFFKEALNRDQSHNSTEEFRGKSRLDIIKIALQLSRNLNGARIVDLGLAPITLTTPRIHIIEDLYEESDVFGSSGNMIDYQNRAEVARFWLAHDLYLDENDLFDASPVRPGRAPARDMNPFVLPRSFFEQIGRIVSDESVAGLNRLLFRGKMNYVPDPTVPSSFEGLERWAMRAGALLNVDFERWPTSPLEEAEEDLASAFFSRDPSASKKLPDRYWEEAWEAVEATQTDRIVGPAEMAVVSDAVIPYSLATTPANSDVIIFHKDFIPDLSRLLDRMDTTEWRVLFANPVFVVMGRTMYEPGVFNAGDVPKSFRRYQASERKLKWPMGRTTRPGPGPGPDPKIGAEH